MRRQASAESMRRRRRSSMIRASCWESFSKKTGLSASRSVICARIACSMSEARASSWGSEAIFSSKSWSRIEIGFINSRTLASMRSSMSRFTFAPTSVPFTPAFSRRNSART